MEAYDQLPQTPANYAPLSPISFLQRAAAVHPERIALIHGSIRRTWSETYTRCRQLASALQRRGIQRGDTVAVMAPNVPELYEAHFGVLMTGGVLNALNVRLDADTLAYIFDHGECDILITDKEFAPVIREALKLAQQSPLVVDINDPQAESGELLGDLTYEDLLSEGDPEFAPIWPEDDWQSIALNYTSGTTGRPKGVVYHSRGAYLLAMGNVLSWELPHHPTYLWTLPMFHCNGWCFPWTMAALAGTNVCLRKVTAANIYNAIADHQVTHLCGAPIVMNMIGNASDSETRELPGPVKIMTAAAPPPPAVIARMQSIGFEVTHVYGLTEVYGPSVVCDWQQSWETLDPEQQALKKGRQGVRYHVLEDLTVADPETLDPVPADGESLGEVLFRGNVVMKGYLKNPEASEEAFKGGWFHSGDLGVLHPDGYIELKDRSKDIIISGGENISSVEVENALYQHPDVLEAAVVARPDEKWGEHPCAFVTLKEGRSLTVEEVIAFCRSRMAGYKVPRTVVFSDLPKTSTGKIRKNELRVKARELS